MRALTSSQWRRECKQIPEGIRDLRDKLELSRTIIASRKEALLFPGSGSGHSIQGGEEESTLHEPYGVTCWQRGHD